MDKTASDALFLLLRSAMTGALLSEEEKALLSDDRLREVITLAKQHDLQHLLAYAFRRNAMLSASQMDNLILAAAYRYERMQQDIDATTAILEEAEIPYLPLKGSVIRALYPEPWMRTSCDIDILVREADLSRAVAALVAKGYAAGGKGPHDIALDSPAHTHIELHYDLLENGLAAHAQCVLREIWQYTSVKDGYRFYYEMSDAAFYFYHIAHMAKHFENGGCGIRPFLDLWLLDQAAAEPSARRSLLETGGLLRFAEAAAALSRVWFASTEPDALTERLAVYVLTGGVYGTTENRVTMQQKKKGGRFSYLLSRIFLSYDSLKFHYPILQKHRWLTPFMEVRRWCKLLFCGHIGRVKQEIACNQNVTEREAEAASALLSELGL